MANKMLIDASHPEETRVVVVRGSRIEEFDFESEHKKQIKGNIYLAKVTRVEPSLQAAFVEYGGNRHGFLAFSEIHPDYYQIPVADRQALMEDEMARVREEEEEEERKIARPRSNPRRPGGGTSIRAAESAGEDSVSEPVDGGGDGEHGFDEARASDLEHDDHALSDNEHEAPELISDDHGSDESSEDHSDDVSDDRVDEAGTDDDGGTVEGSEVSPSGHRRARRSRQRRSGNAEEAPHSDDEEEVVDEIGAEDAMEEVPVRIPRAPRKQYKIQEVIKRRQILLVQVVKEERGNKGAALTTYLSLAGRYSVLMPNTARGGGISRKITNIADRKRLKEVARELEVPKGMGIILRTAGAMRTKAEVKRDYEYLMRLWETVRSLTLSSTAPALTYEEGSLIKRSIRDLYNKDIDQVLVSGEAGYREAKDFMRMLMPSQAKVVQPYRDPVPIFARGGIEAQLDKMLLPHVTLKSGGYIIINQTEALVAIDVNSGRSTREHSVEDTAYQTNLEAAEEVARQLRLRDLAGLIVIDFIDMDEKRNNRAVEKKMKDCLKDDRARIQVGRISHFGLMEMSRQRIRASVLESTTRICPTCDGVGHIRSNSSLALHVVRAVEEHLQKHSTHDLVVKVPTATALYVLNEKRHTIEELEQHYGLRILVEADDSHGHQHCAIEHGAEAVRRAPRLPALAASYAIDEEEPELEEDAPDPVEALEEDIGATESSDGGETEEQRRRKRRRRRRRGGSDEHDTSESESETASAQILADDGSFDEGEASGTSGDEDGDGVEAEGDEAGSEDRSGRKRRRRGRRGGRRTREGEGPLQADGEPSEGGLHGGDGDAVVADGYEPADASFDDVVADARVPETIHAANDDRFAALRDAAPVQAGHRTDEDRTAGAADAIEPAAAVEEQYAEVPADGAASEPAETHEPALADAVETPHVEDAELPAVPAEPQVTSNDASEDDASKPKRTGWWARRSFF